MPSKPAAGSRKQSDPDRFYTLLPSPLGPLTLVSTGDGGALAELHLEKAELSPRLTKKDNLPLFIRIRKWLDAYFAGKNPPSDEIPLAPEGTLFRKKVWQVLQTIPYGKTVTYQDVANAVSGVPRAVGGAVGANPIPILIPCHRVIGSNGKLTGFSGGLEKKICLLKLEGTLLL